MKDRQMSLLTPQNCKDLAVWYLSVCQTDAEALERLILIHSPQPPKILDCTYGLGKIWEECPFFPEGRMDIRHLDGVNTVGDFAIMDGVRDNSFNTLVFDPPHLPVHAASEHSSRIWEHRYGITGEGEGREGDNVVGLFRPFLLQAKRVLIDDGIVLAKIADIVHNHRYQWQHVSFIQKAMEIGMTPCDMIVKCDPKAGNLKSSKWKRQYHLRKAHCYWIVVRNSGRCEREHDA